MKNSIKIATTVLLYLLLCSFITGNESYCMEVYKGTDRILYVDGSPYRAAMAYTPDRQNKHFYIHRDRQGSVRAISDALGVTVARYFYDAWGRHTDECGTPYAPYMEPIMLLGRGYTGHEHLPWFNLINMNARLYDPAVGRFLSPDPYVIDPGYLQDFNRYTYARNNPLMYTDENGEFIHLIIGAIIGGTINWAFNGAEFSWKGLGYFGVGAAAGALGAGIGTGISSAIAGGSFGAGFMGSSSALTAASSFWGGAAIGGGAGFSSGFTTGFGNGLLGDQSFSQALWSGTKSGLIGGLSGAAIGGLWGGIDAAIDGRRFWDGATVQREIFSDVNVVPVRQVGKNNCLPASGESINRSLGGDIRQVDLRRWAGGDANYDALIDTDFWLETYAGENTGHRVSRIGSEGAIRNALNNGGRVAATIPGTGSISHSVVVKSIFQQTVTKINGNVTQTIMLRIMDPGTGGFKNIPLSTVINLFSITP